MEEFVTAYNGLIYTIRDKESVVDKLSNGLIATALAKDIREVGEFSYLVFLRSVSNQKTANTANHKGQAIAASAAVTTANASVNSVHHQTIQQHTEQQKRHPLTYQEQQHPSYKSNKNFSGNYNRNFAKIRQHDPDVSPRPRRPYQNDSSSRYYNKSDGIGQGRIIADNNGRSVASGGEEGGGTRHYQGNYYRSATPPDQLSKYHQGAPQTPPYQRRQFGNGGSSNTPPRFGNSRNNGVNNGLGEYLSSSQNINGSNIGGQRGGSSERNRNGDVGAGEDIAYLERGQSAPLKTEAPRQSGPESCEPGRESAIPPASRRWVPPSLRPQHGLTEKDKNDAIFRKVRGILNKLTPEKFQELSDDLLKIDLNSTVILHGVIYLIFEKALDEPKYSSMYAQLCKRLSKEAPDFDPPNSNTCTFLRLLLNVCRDKFENRSNSSAAVNTTITSTSSSINSDNINNDDPLSLEEEEKRHISKQRMLGNVKFIGELHKLEMLSRTVLHRCIQDLLDRKHTPGTTVQDWCEDMECLSQLIRTCGKNLDTEQGKKLMNQYFEIMEKRSKSPKYPPRIRFMLRDIIELRNNNWVPRKVATTEGPVPIRQVRTDDDNMIRPSHTYRTRDMRNERDNDNWMNRFPLNLQPGYNDMFSGLSVTGSSPIMSPGYNNRHHNQRNNQNNYNNRFNKHNNQHNNSSHNNLSYTSMMNNKDLAPRFKRNLISATQDPVENLQMRPAANSLLFKANMNIKTPPMLPMSTPPPSSTSINSSPSVLVTTPTTAVNNNFNSHQSMRPTSAPSSDLSQTSIQSNASSHNSLKSVILNTGGGHNINNTANRDATAVTKQGSTEKPAKQGKKDKGPNKEEVLKRVMTFLNENLINEKIEADDKNIDDIVANFLELKVPDKFMKDACICILNEIIDKSEQQYERCIGFLQQLRKENKVTGNALLDAFKQIVNKMSEKEATIPRITTLLACLLARAVHVKLCKISDIASYTENGQHYPLFLLVLQQLHKILGKEALGNMFADSKVNLMTTLPEADRSKDRMAEILEDRSLNFLYPLLKLQAELLKQIQADPNPQAFYKWIKSNVDSKYYTDSGFVMALMTVILKYITQETTLTEGTDPKKLPEKSTIEKEEALLHRYCHILEAFLNGHNDLQLVAVYALQVYCYNVEFPKGMLCRWFKNLYEANVIEEEAFFRWKEELNDEYPGKGGALFQVNNWLTWLEQAESEDED